MKIAIWAYTAAVVLASASVVLICFEFRIILQQQFHGKNLPALTELLMQYYLWIWGVPLPWLVAATWLSLRGNATPNRSLAFVGFATIAIVFVFACAAVVLPLPFITIVLGLTQ